MEAKVGQHLGTSIGGRRVILSETLVLRETDHEVVTAVQGIVHITFRFKEKPGKVVDVNVGMEDSNKVVVEIDDGQERGGFTHWSTFANDSTGPDLVLAIFVDPIGPTKRTRQFTYTLTLGPE